MTWTANCSSKNCSNRNCSTCLNWTTKRSCCSSSVAAALHRTAARTNSADRAGTAGMADREETADTADTADRAETAAPAMTSLHSSCRHCAFGCIGDRSRIAVAQSRRATLKCAAHVPPALAIHTSLVAAVRSRSAHPRNWSVAIPCRRQCPDSVVRSTRVTPASDHRSPIEAFRPPTADRGCPSRHHSVAMMCLYRA